MPVCAQMSGLPGPTVNLLFKLDVCVCEFSDRKGVSATFVMVTKDVEGLYKGGISWSCVPSPEQKSPSPRMPRTCQAQLLVS